MDRVDRVPGSLVTDRRSEPASADCPWAPAVAPAVAPPDRSRIVTVVDALVTGLRKGPLRTASSPRKWLTGAVHTADGRLVTASQRLWAGDPDAPVPADPRTVDVPESAPRISGTWLYVGHWFPQFGHFLAETLTALWPDPRDMAADGLTGLLGHRDYRGPTPEAGPGRAPLLVQPSAWQDDLVRLAGYGGLEVRVVRGRSVRVDRLLVPSRPMVLKSWTLRPAVEVWRRVAEACPGGSEPRVFLSRRLFHERERRPEERASRVRVERGWDEVLERVVADAGLRVVHPETLDVSEQVSLVRGARVLVGSSGSQLHLSAFAAPGTRVLEIGDTRSRCAPLPAQRVIDAACGHVTTFVPYGDVEQLRRCLTSV